MTMKLVGLLLLAHGALALVGVRSRLPPRAARLRAATAESRVAESAADDRAIRAIAGPTLLGTLLDPFLSVVDTAWVSRLGTVPLGAVAASSEIFTLTIAVSLALRESASSTIARLLAEGRTADAEAWGVRTLQLAAVGGVCLAALVAGPLAAGCVGLMGAPPASPLHADALAYARGVQICL